MAPVSVPYGVQLLYEAGIAPPDPRRAALADASPEALASIAREELAMQTTAALMALDQPPSDNASVSAGAMETILAVIAAAGAPSESPPAQVQSTSGKSGTVEEYANSTVSSAAAAPYVASDGGSGTAEAYVAAGASGGTVSVLA